MISKHLSHAWQRIIFLSWYSDMTLMRAYLAGTSMLWGTLLIIFGAADGRVAEVIGQYVSVDVWAWLFVLHGAATFVAVLTDMFPSWAVITLRTVGCFVWTSAVTSMVLVEPIHPANAANISFAMASWWLLARTER